MDPLKNTLKDTDFAEIHEKVEILSTDDEKLKLIGSLLSNDVSRNILKLLFEQEMTANDIAKKMEMLLSLAIFHLQKMQEAGIVTISKIGKNSKGRDMKYYGMTKLAIIILPSSISEKAKNSKSLSSSLNRIFKFAAIGIVGLASWLITKPSEKSGWSAGEEPLKLPFGDWYLSVIIGLSVIIVGLIIERILTSLKK